MSTKKAPPRRNTDVIQCENCGEEYSITYKRCPFCDERPAQSGYRGIVGRRISAASGGKANPIQVFGLAVSLVLILTALIIVIRYVSPMFMGNNPAHGSSSGQSSTGSSQTQVVEIQGLTLSRTDFSLQPNEPYQVIATTDPKGANVTITWTSANPDIATVDEFGNITNVYKGSDEVPVVITATVGDVTAQCTVHCLGDGTGENIVPETPDTSSGSGSQSGSTSGGQSGTSGNQSGSSNNQNSGGDFAPNTEVEITGASGGLNIRSGPGTTYEVKASTSNGATVEILEKAQDGWYKIKYSTGGGNFEEGYVLGTYLTAKDS